MLPKTEFAYFEDAVTAMAAARKKRNKAVSNYLDCSYKVLDLEPQVVRDFVKSKPLYDAAVAALVVAWEKRDKTASNYRDCIQKVLDIEFRVVSDFVKSKPLTVENMQKMKDQLANGYENG